MASFTLHETLLHLPSMHCEKAAAFLTSFFSTNSQMNSFLFFKHTGKPASEWLRAFLPVWSYDAFSDSAETPVVFGKDYFRTIVSFSFKHVSVYFDHFMSISARIITHMIYSCLANTWMKTAHFIDHKLNKFTRKLNQSATWFYVNVCLVDIDRAVSLCLSVCISLSLSVTLSITVYFFF